MLKYHIRHYEIQYLQYYNHVHYPYKSIICCAFGGYCITINIIIECQEYQYQNSMRRIYIIVMPYSFTVVLIIITIILFMKIIPIRTRYTLYINVIRYWNLSSFFSSVWREFRFRFKKFWQLKRISKFRDVGDRTWFWCFWFKEDFNLVYLTQQ